MKGLNLKNGMNNWMMQNVKSTIMNSSNTIARIVIVALMITNAVNLFGYEDTESESNGKPYYSGGIWYSMYSSYEHKSNDYSGGTGSYDRKPLVYPPTNESLKFTYWNHTSLGTKSTYSIKLEVNDLQSSSWGNTQYSDKIFRPNGTKYYSKYCRKDITQISIKRNDGNGNYTTKDLKIKLARHVRLYTGEPDASSVGDIYTLRSFSNTTKIGSSANCTIYIRSFLTTTNLKMKVVQRTGDASSTTDVNDVFKIKYLGTLHNDVVTITNDTTICGYPGATGDRTTSSSSNNPINTSLIPVVIEFYPNEIKTRKATLIFYDGSETNILASVDLDGTGSSFTYPFPDTEVLHYTDEQKTLYVAYTATATSPVTISAPSDYKDKYQYSTNGTNWYYFKQNLTLTSGNSFKIRFTPLGGITTPGFNLTVTQGNKSYTIPISGATTPTNVSIDAKQSFNNLTTTQTALCTINLDIFEIKITNTTNVLNEYHFNTDGSTRYLIQFSSLDPTIVKMSTSNNRQFSVVGKGGEGDFIQATLPATNDYNLSTCKIHVKVSKVAPTVTWNTDFTKTYPVFTLNSNNEGKYNTVTLSATRTPAGTFTYSPLTTPTDDATLSGSTLKILRNSTAIKVRATSNEDDKYTSASPSDATVKTKKVTPTITIGTLPSMTYGDAAKNLSDYVSYTYQTNDAGYKPKITVTATPDILTVTNNGSTIDNIKLSVKQAGTLQSLKIDIEGDDYYFESSSKTENQTAIFSKKGQTITWNSSDLDGKFTGESVTMSATASSGLTTFEYSSSDETIAKYENGKIKFLRGGQVTITVRQPGNGSWKDVTSSKTVIVGLDFGTTTKVGRYSDPAYLVLGSFGLTDNNVKVYTSSDNFRIIYSGHISGHPVDTVGRIYTTVQTAKDCGKSDNLKMELFPLDDKAHSGYVYITGQSLSTPIQVPIKGTGVYNPVVLKYIEENNKTIDYTDCPNASAFGDFQLAQQYSREGSLEVSLKNDKKAFRVFRSSADAEAKNIYNNPLSLEYTKTYATVQFYPNYAMTNGDASITVRDTILVRNTVNVTGYSHDVTYKVPVSAQYRNPSHNLGNNPYGQLIKQTFTMKNKSNGFTVTSNNPEVFRINGETTNPVSITGNSFDVVFTPQQTAAYPNTEIYIKENGLAEQVCTLYVSGSATNNTFEFTPTEVGLKAPETKTLTITSFLEGYELDIVDGTSASGTTSVIGNFQINSTRHTEPFALTNGSYSIVFAPKSKKSNNATIVARQTAEPHTVYPLASITAEALKRQIILSWNEPSDTIVLLDNACYNNFVTAKDVNGNDVDVDIKYTITNDVSNTFGYCPENTNSGVFAINNSGKATISAEPADLISFGYNEDFISKGIKKSAKTGQTIININSNITAIYGKTSTIPLNATAVLSSDGVTPTGKTINYSIQTGARTDLVTVVNNSYLSVNTTGTTGVTKLEVKAEGDEDYETAIKIVTVAVKEEGDCNFITLFDSGENMTESKTYTYTWTNSEPAGYLQDISITSESTTIPFIQIEVQPRFTVDVVGKDNNGNEVYRSAQKSIETAGTVNMFDGDVLLPRNTKTIEVVITDNPRSIGSWELIKSKFSLGSVIVTQASYLERCDNETINCGTAEIGQKMTVEKPVFDFSALATEIVSVTIDGDQKNSFSLDNTSEFDISCGTFGTRNFHISYTPEQVGECNAKLIIVGYKKNLDGSKTDETLTVPIKCTGTPKTQSVVWNDAIENLTYRDEPIDLSAYGVYSLAQSATGQPVTYSWENVPAGGTPCATVIPDGANKYKLQINHPGNGRLTAKVEGDVNAGGDSILLSASMSKNITIDKITPAVTFNNTPYVAKTNGDGLTLSVTVEKGQSVQATYTPINGSDQYIQISGDQLTIKKPANVTCTVNVHIAANDYYYETNAQTTVEVKDVPITFNISSSYSIPVEVNSAAKDLANVNTLFKNAEAFVDCNYSDVVYNIINITKAETDNAAEVNSNTFTAYKHAEVTLQVKATSPSTATEHTENLKFTIPYGTFAYKTAGNWGTQANWSRTDILPDENHNVSIEANCTIPSTYSARVHGVTNSDPAKLVLKADDDHSATLIFEEGSPQATVEIYLRGHKNNDGIADNPDWQYRGFIGDYQSGLSSNVKVYKWDESLASGDQSCWVDSTSTKHGAWTGYSMANMTDAAATYTYQTVLLPTTGGQTYNLSYHQYNGDKNSRNNNGVNIVTNSYSAPIKVSELTFSGMHSYVYFFNTQKHDSWTKRKDVFVTCPSQTCSAVLENDLIPAGQAFLVQATHDGSTDGSSSSITVNASSIIGQASGRFYAPEEERRFNILEIKVKGNSAEDEVYLLESDECNRKYDNGYDGLKMFSTGIPQIYANNSFGGTSINADSSMLGQYIGFRAAADVTEYEITFDIDRLEGYDELYLFDHLTKRYADILAGSTYRFTATEADDPERFQIMGRREDGTYFTGADQWIEVVARRALLHGFDDLEETVRITDLMGNLLWTDNSKNGPWFDIPEVPAGVYIIHCGKATAKFIVK